MAGQTARTCAGWRRRCRSRPANQDYERAARLRDDIKALERAVEKQAVVLADGTDADVVAFAEDPLEAAVQVFYVRGGRVRGQRGWVVDKVEDVTTATWSSTSSSRSTATRRRQLDAVPREVLVPALPTDAAALGAGCPSSGAAGSTCGCRSAATSAP
jgi:excinuclease ABC subunit C